MALGPLPERIGKYEIVGLLGRGAMGVVYRGFDPHIKRPVAIKTIRKDLLGEEGAAEAQDLVARFRNEAQAVGRLMHPGIVAVYELGEDAEQAFIAMEFVEGSNLDQILAATPLLPERQVFDIMDQLLAALEHAHAQGVWHRDIKPANLIMGANGQIKLTDFGIARIENAGLTQVSLTIGTPGYMAPEQYTGEGIDNRTDIFACGVLLYRLLAGRMPFTGPPEQIMYKILHEEPPPPSALADPPRSSQLDAVVARAMAKQSANRPASAQMLRAALRASSLPAGRPGPDDGATVIVPAGQRSAAQPATPPVDTGPRTHTALGSGLGGGLGSGVGSGVGSGFGSALGANWDAETLARVEKALAPHVGPMARVMVKQAAKTCADLNSLTDAVAAHISEGPGRRQFLASLSSVPATAVPAGAGVGTSLATGTQPTASAGPAAPPAPGAEGLTEAQRDHALAVLSRHMGPVARILVKRAFEKSTSRSAFHQSLVQASELDPVSLLAELRSGP